MKLAQRRPRYSHVSLSLNDCIHVLRVDHAQHPVTENARRRGLLHGQHQDRKAKDNCKQGNEVFCCRIFNHARPETTGYPSVCLENIHHCLLVVLHTAPHDNLHNTAHYDKASHALKADGSCSVRKPVQLETSKDRTPQRTFKC